MLKHGMFAWCNLEQHETTWHNKWQAQSGEAGNCIEVILAIRADQAHRTNSWYQPLALYLPWYDMYVTC